MRRFFFLYSIVVACSANLVDGTETYTARFASSSSLRQANKCDGFANLNKVVTDYSESNAACLMLDGSVKVSGTGSAADISQIADALKGNVTDVVSNRCAFAAMKSDGSVVTWGYAHCGGNNTMVQSAIGEETVLQLFSSPRSKLFGALISNQSMLVVWGYSFFDGGSSAVPTAVSTGVVSMLFNRGAAAALRDGRVQTWGSPYEGGDSSSVAGDIASNVTSLVASNIGFAATKEDGNVISWGAGTFQVSSLGSVQYVVGTSKAFAALLSNGSVTAWGKPEFGGNTTLVATDLTSGVTQLVATTRIFAALKDDGEVISWGGGFEFSHIQDRNLPLFDPNLTNIKKLFANDVVAALDFNDKITTFGYSKSAHDIFMPVLPPVQDVIPLDGQKFKIVANQTMPTVGDLVIGAETMILPHDNSEISHVVASMKAFAGITKDGKVKTWGSTLYGGYSGNVAAQLENSVFVNVSATAAAFAALSDAGSVVTWGAPDYGGDPSEVQHMISSNVKALYSNTYAFTALKHDGSVVSWGNPQFGGISGNISNVIDVVGEWKYFAAFKSDGSVVTWGYGCGDSSSVAHQLSSGVMKIIHNRQGCAVLKNDSSVVTWGIASSASSSGYLPHLTSGVVEIYATQSAFAALKEDNSVIGWNFHSTIFFSDVRKVVANQWYIATLHFNGSVSHGGFGGFGSITDGALRKELESGVIELYTTENSIALAAIKGNGTVVVWGHSEFYFRLPQLHQDVAQVIMGYDTVALLTTNGQVNTFYHSRPGIPEVAEWLQEKVIAVYSSGNLFAALRSDGVAVTWREDNSYGWASDGTTTATQYVLHNVTEIITSNYVAGWSNREFNGFTAIVRSSAPPTSTNHPTQMPTAYPTMKPTPLRFQDGSMYTGDLNNDNQMDGYGIIEFPNGNKFRGYFKRGARANTGEFIRSDGLTQVINWAEPQHALKPGYAREAPPATYYLGCVADGPSRDLNHLAFSLSEEDTNSETNIIAECETICRQGAFWFFGLQEGNKCFCGNDYGRLEVHPGDPLFRGEKECDFTCGGVLAGTGLKCGGHFRNSVFRIGIVSLIF